MIEKAQFVVAGYAFTKREDEFISILDLNSPNHAALIDANGNVLETNMDDIELEIVINNYWAINKKYIIDKEYA